MSASVKAEQDLVEFIAKFQHNPLGFVLACFPWGEGELREHQGPRAWQRKRLEAIGKALNNGATRYDAIQLATASGHGIGKSALVSWVILWAISTLEDSRGVVTANTEKQLTTKTWPEVAKWHRLCLCSHWFEFTATSLFSTDAKHAKTWRIDAIPWSDTNTEAFAGLHNQGRRILLIFDEASAISDSVWQVAEGALTDAKTEIIWCVFGNPTRNTGRFRECFGKLAHRWNHEQIDSRTVEGANKKQHDAWIQDYGEDSDFVRVRIKGQFPRAGSSQFIASDIVERAATREDGDDGVPICTQYDPVVMGVDVARFGDDESVITIRRGRDARTIPAERFRGQDTMFLVGRIASLCQQWGIDAVFIDETGLGAGVVDRCRQLQLPAFGVNNGSRAITAQVDGELVANRAAEMWALGRSWLRSGGVIENDPDLRAQIEGREYGYNVHNAIVLERKDDMKKRGLASPDRADSLFLTFAMPIPHKTRPRGWEGEPLAFCATEPSGLNFCRTEE